MAYNYTNKPQTTANFLRFDEKEIKELVLTDWDFSKQAAGYLFKCFVEEENGEPVDKIWTVWDYESTQLLKKKLTTKYTEPKKIKVKMYINDEDDQCFELL